VGDLDKVKRVVKLLGFVNCADGFSQQPAVVNGASDLFVKVGCGPCVLGRGGLEGGLGVREHVSYGLLEATAHPARHLIQEHRSICIDLTYSSVCICVYCIHGPRLAHLQVFEERGAHARSAVGTNALPLNVSVEIEAIVEVEE
jgi:enamine deaminase RidA (YjgF/YER057c/UK114 family)